MKTLEQLVNDKGLRLIDHGNGHFQILGGERVVNYWPHSKRRSAHVCGSEDRAKRNVSPAEAVEMAGEPLKVYADDPKQRTPEQWAELSPKLRFGFK